MLAVVVWLLAGCSPAPTELTGDTMGTTYSIQVVDLPAGLGAEALRAEVEAVLEGVNASLSTYRPESELSRFNGSADTAWIDASPGLVTVLAEAKRVSALTGGAFDVTVGPLVNLWGFGPGGGEDRVPDPAMLSELHGRVGHERLHVRETPPAVRKDRPDLYVDLSAIAKGYGVDRVAERLESLGARRYLVEIGGEVRARGENARGTPWQVAVERPVAGERAAYGVLDVDGAGVATSGDYRNFFEADGRRYSHTIDPATGRPVTHSLASVTVVADTCMTADALATGLLVLGPQAGPALAEREGIAALFIVRDDDRFRDQATPAFQNSRFRPFSAATR